MRNSLAPLACAALLASCPLARATVVEINAADFADGTDISTLTDGVRVSSSGGPPGSDVFVYSREIRLLAGGPLLRVLGPQPPGGIPSFGSVSADGSLPQFVLRADFATATDFAAIDILPTDGFDPAVLRFFDAGDTLLQELTTTGTGGVAVRETASINRAVADIAYMEVLSFRLIGGLPVAPENFLVDRLRFNRVDAVREPASLALALLAAPLLLAGLRGRHGRASAPRTAPARS